MVHNTDSPPSSGLELWAGASHTRLTMACSGFFCRLSLGLALLPGETLQGSRSQAFCRKEGRKLRVSWSCSRGGPEGWGVGFCVNTYSSRALGMEGVFQIAHDF